MIDGELVTGRLERLDPGRHQMRFGRPERSEQRGNRHVRLAVNYNIDWRQALIVHAPAVVQTMIDRNLHELGGDVAARILERAGDVDPVETENDVGGTDGFRCLRREHRSAGRTCM